MLKKILSSALLLISPMRAEKIPYTEENQPEVSSEYLYLYDIANDQLLYSIQGETTMYPASMTKVMTVLLAIENFPDPEQKVTMTEEMWTGLIEADATIAGYWPGTTVTVRDLLYGAILPSGADAVNAIAITLDGSIPAFVERMNRRAEELGMASTHFANATGLHDSAHVSSCEDIAILFNEALKHDVFQEVLLTREYLAQPENGEAVTLTSTSWPAINNGPGTYQIPGYLGGKTGFTNPAGRCMVSHAEFNGMHLLLVTGKSVNTGHIADAATVYNWYAENYGYRTAANAGDIIAVIPVEDSFDVKTITITMPESVSMDLPLDAEIRVEHDLPAAFHAPIEKGEKLGSVRVVADGQTIYETEVFSDLHIKHSILLHGWNASVRIFNSHRTLFAIGGAAVIVLLIADVLVQGANKKKRRKTKKKRSTKNTH